MNVAHPKYVLCSEYLSEYAWIRQFLNQGSVCVPIGNVSTEGAFGFLKKEAAMPKNLLEYCPHLFSNNWVSLLNEKVALWKISVTALTCSKSRELTRQLHYEPEEITPGGGSERPPQVSVSDSFLFTDDLGFDKGLVMNEEKHPLVPSPSTTNYENLWKVDRDTLAHKEVLTHVYRICVNLYMKVCQFETLHLWRERGLSTDSIRTAKEERMTS